MSTTPPKAQARIHGFRSRFKNITADEEHKVYQHKQARLKLFAVRPKRATGQKANQNKIYRHQRARLNIPNDVPNEAIGLKAILEGCNLANLVYEGKLKVMCYAQSKNQIKIHITNCQTAVVLARLQAGQFFMAKSSSNQYLVTREAYEWQVPLGQCVKTCQTYCFDGEFSAPSKDDQYLIGTVKSGLYQQGMNQFEVWQIKLKMQSKAEDFKSEETELIAMSKSDIKMMMTKWGDELNKW